MSLGGGSDRNDDNYTSSIIPIQSAAKQVAWGSIAGMIGELFDYPFDLAKVRLQSQLLTPPSDTRQRFLGPLDCLVRTWRDEGVRGLYRGLPLPLVGSMIDTGAVFFSYSAFQNLIRAYAFPNYNALTDPSPPLSLLQLCLAAASAGFAHSSIITPIELVKCRMQVQMLNTDYIKPPPTPSPHHHHNPALKPVTTTHTRSLSTIPSNTAYLTQQIANPHPVSPPGPMAIIRSTLKTHGIRGLWLGHTGTILRETGGTAAWFATKEWAAASLQKHRLGRDTIVAEDSLLAWESAASGAVAGAVCTIAMYPVDTVKNAMQTQEELRSHRSNPRGYGMSNSFWKTTTRMYTAHGLRGLYAGCGMTVARTVPSSGIVFMVYDVLCAFLGA